MEISSTADALALVEENRRKRFRKRLVRLLSLVGAIVLLGWAVSPYMKIGFNATASVDGYVFLIIKNEMPMKGELVAFWPPENDFYPNNWFVKYVGGVAGDKVERKNQDFFINGNFVGKAKTQSKSGISLSPGQEGVIPHGYFFAWTSHPDSFDSRYEQIGWISEVRVIGRAYRIF